MGSGSISEGNSSWVSFFRRANEFIDSGELEDCENRYKREVARSLRKARKVLPTGSDELAELVEKGLDSNLIDFRIRQNVHKWMDDYPDDALETLEAIWTRDRMPLDQRIKVFCEKFPREVIGGAAGTLMNLASVLLMCLDEESYPPFRIRLANKVYKLTGYNSPGSKADEATLYRHFLGFLDRFKEESQLHGLNLRHRLDTQSLIWRSQEEEDPFALPRLGSTQPPLCDLHQQDWNEFAKLANELIESGILDKQQVKPKLEVGCKFRTAKEAVLNDAEDWARLAKAGVLAAKDERLVFYRSQTNFHDWINTSPDEALQALKAIWTKDGLSIDKRIRAFCERFPEEVIGGGAGTRMSVTAQLLMGLNAEQFPPFAKKRFENAYKSTGYDLPDRNADEAAQYTHFLGFLDRFIEGAQAYGVNLRHRLDAHIVVWLLDEEDALPKLDSRSPEPKTLRELADELLLPTEYLEEIKTLLEDKRQVIFQGPPGTGKTYVAQALAKCLAGSEDRITLVQFHSSYAYEDFVRGFRPTITESEHAGFTLQDGPLLRAAEKARNDKDSKHFLIIDEINRGNLAKVFGELYFLLEYRDKSIRMQYRQESEKDFSLPKNLYIIGTMNTADRSIALVDLALRRRFYFIEFHPDDEPVKSVLRKWLKEKNLDDVEGVADIVDRANRLLQDDKHAAIGPSYFMKDGLDKKMVERIWNHSVIPYVEERLIGDDDRINQFNLRTLSHNIAHPINWGDDKEQERNEAESDAGDLNNEAN